MTSVEFEHVKYAPSGTAPGGVPVLDDVSLALEQGTTTAVLGRSGSGKTTLLRMVNGMVVPTSGNVRVRGVETTQLDMIALRRGIGYVIQESGLFPHFTAERNVGLVPELQGRPQAEVAQRTAALFAQVGLDADVFSKRLPLQLSGGQRQRVGLARALAADPDILLMDEPFGALDPITRAEMQRMLRDLLLRIRKTVLLVTHDLQEAIYLASRIVFLHQGKLVADLPADQVMQSQVPEVREYVQALRHEPSSSSGDGA